MTSIAYDRESNYLYLTGLVNTASSWNFSASSSYFTHLSEAHHHHQYSIARLQMKGYNHYCHVNSNTRRKLHITQSKLRHRRTSTVQSGIQYNHNRRLAGQKKSNDSSTTNSTILNRPWTLTWEWLPGFSAYPSPIQRLTPGTKDLKGSLFIAAYTDMTDEISPVSSLLLWTPPQNHEDSYNLTVLGGNDHKIRGLVSSVLVDLSLPYSPTDSRKDQDDDITHHKYPDNPILPPHDLNRDTDYTFLILFACVGLGILLGLSFTVSCFYRSQEEANINNITLANYRGKEDSGQSSGGISLRTLSDGYGNAMDFKECFERAMKTRHLSTYETLIMINPKEIMLNRIIGEGSFGRVWSGQWRHNKVAVKEFIFAQAAIAGGMTLQRNNIIEEIVGEAGVMACLRHPKILQLYGCSLTMQAIWIVSELCVKGSLKMLLMAGPVPAIPSINHGSNSLKPIQIEDPEASLGLMNSPMEGVELSVLQKLSILMDIADGMQYLHQRNPPIIHRDLKSHNIFITETTPGNYIAKIGDWGSARAIALTNSKSMTQGVGTACWLSPEVINNAHFSKASDVYAFGIILWEVHTRQEIYEGLSAAQIIAKVAHEELRPSVPRNCPWAKLMTQCWKQDPAQRPNFDTILKVLSSLHLKYTARINHNRQQHLFQQSEQATTPVAVKQQGHIEYFQSPSIDITEGNSYLASKSNESPYNTGTSAGSSKNGSGGMVKRSSLRSAPSVMELSYLVSTSYTSNTPIHSNLMSYETMDAGSKGSKNNSSSNNSPLGRPPQSSTATTFASTIINSTTSDGTIASASQLRSSPTRQSQRSNPVANINASAGNHRSPAQYGYNSSTQNPSLLTAFDSFHPSLENIQFYESPLIGNNGSGKGEPSTYHLAPEIVSAQLSVLVEEEPPDPLDFLFQESTPLNGSSSSSNKSKFK